MEKNKYYTPEISEFYVGFEYQYKSTFHDGTVKTQEQFDDDIKYKWNDKKVDSIQELSYVQRSLHGRNAELNRCGTRVKFLDKELIIELGWKLVWTENETLVFRFNDWILTFNDFNKQIIITFGNDSLSRRFNGKLKNKNQLQILMKWLEIL